MWLDPSPRHGRSAPALVAAAAIVVSLLGCAPVASRKTPPPTPNVTQADRSERPDRGDADPLEPSLDTAPMADEVAEASSALPVDRPNGGWEPAWSPDGRSIAFLSSPPHAPPDLWIMDADGSRPRRLTTRGVEQFRWSGEGRSIDFMTRRRGFDEVLRLDLETGTERHIAGLPPSASLPVYSPDESLLAFTAPGEDEKTRDLWIGTADGSRMEPVTDKLGVRSILWGPDSRRVFFEPGKAYGVGLWEIDLATMDSKVILNSYVGTPRWSATAGRLAYPYPTNPGEFAVHTCAEDGSDERTHVAPRLVGREIDWDADGTGVLYLGRDGVGQPENPDSESAGEDLPPGHSAESRTIGAGSQVISLWRLDLASGAETRVSPPDLHTLGFDLSPDGSRMVFSGLMPGSLSGELFLLDLTKNETLRIAGARPSYWMPVPSRDSTKVAFFTNESGVDTIEVVDLEGKPLASYPGFVQEGLTRLSWLPVSEGLLVVSPRELLAFTDDGPIGFPNRKDFRTFLDADVSIRSDKVLISAIPRHGAFPGLYMLEAIDGEFVLTDFRYPAQPEIAAELYLQPRWSFDEKQVAFSDRIDLWVMDADGTHRRWITDFAGTNASGEGTPVVASHPVWSVSREWIAHTRFVFDAGEISRQLWLVRSDGSEPRVVHTQVVDSAFAFRQEEFTNLPFFDLTDEHLIFTVADDGVPDLYSLNLADDRIERLTSDGAVFPVLLPEDDLIVYTSLEGGHETLRVMNSDGTENRAFLTPSDAGESTATTHRDAEARR